MLSIVFIAALVWVAAKMLIWGIKAAWGMSMTKKQLQECLINRRIWEEEQKRNRW